MLSILILPKLAMLMRFRIDITLAKQRVDSSNDRADGQSRRLI